MTPANANPWLADAEWLRGRYEEDRAPVTEIATEAGCDPSRVWAALQRHGIPTRGRADGAVLRPLKVREIRAAYRATAGEVGPRPAPLGNRAAAARLLGVSREKLEEAEMRLGLVVHDRADEAGQLYASGLSLPAVAEQMGLSARHAARLVHASGVTLRPRGRPTRVVS